MNVRDCFLSPPDEAFVASDMLAMAADYFSRNEMELARNCIRSADMPEVLKWRREVMAGYKPAIHGPRLNPPVPSVPKSERHPRYISAGLKRQLLERDGYICRFCGMRLMHQITCKRLETSFPEATRVSLPNWERHALIGGMVANYDHVLPWSKGGETSLENMVITCPPCNYGRGEWTLAEAHLNDPRLRPILSTDWMGLDGAFQ